MLGHGGCGIFDHHPTAAPDPVSSTARAFLRPADHDRRKVHGDADMSFLRVFDLRARLRAQQSSLLMRLESCSAYCADNLVPDGGDGRAAGVSTEPTAADLPSRVRRSPALYAVQPLPPGVWPSRTPPGWLSSRVGRPGAASPTTLPNAAVDARASAVSGLAGGRGGLPKRPHCACGRIVCWYERTCCQKRRRWPLEQPAIATGSGGWVLHRIYDEYGSQKARHTRFLALFQPQSTCP